MFWSYIKLNSNVIYSQYYRYFLSYYIIYIITFGHMYEHSYIVRSYPLYPHNISSTPLSIVNTFTQYIELDSPFTSPHLYLHSSISLHSILPRMSSSFYHTIYSTASTYLHFLCLASLFIYHPPILDRVSLFHSPPLSLSLSITAYIYIRLSFSLSPSI